MRDTIEQELYERNNKRNIAEVSLNFTSSSSNQLGVQVSCTSTGHTVTLTTTLASRNACLVAIQNVIINLHTAIIRKHIQHQHSFSTCMGNEMYSSTVYSSGQISHLISGKVRFRPDSQKNTMRCILTNRKPHTGSRTHWSE